MSDPKFITVGTAFGEKTINIDSISSIEAFGGGGSTIILKEVKNGSNVEVLTTVSTHEIRRLISSLSTK